MKKGMVYKIELDNEIYVGSTEQKLCERQSNHNHDLKKFPNRKLYKTCIEQGIEKIKLIWVADIEFNSTAEKRMKEEEYRKKLNAKLNSIRCYITEEEAEDNRKEYIKNNKEKITQYKKEYRKNNKEIISQYNKNYSKEYILTHREQLLDYKKKYYETNKDILNAKQKEKIECPICKSMIGRSSIARHKKTKKCIEYINSS